MAILSNSELDAVRRRLIDSLQYVAQSHDKPEIHAALQAVEDVIDTPAFRDAFTTAIAATAPTVAFSNAEMRLLARAVFIERFL